MSTFWGNWRGTPRDNITFYQDCATYRTQIDLLLTEKETYQDRKHFEEANKSVAIKSWYIDSESAKSRKWNKSEKKNTENVSRDKKRFKSATELHPYGFLAILNFWILDAKRKPKKYPQNV